MLMSHLHTTLQMMQIQYTGLSHTLQTAVIAALIFVVCGLMPKLKYRLHLAKLPDFGESTSKEKQRQAYLLSAKSVYIDGYKKVSIHYQLIMIATDKLTV